MADDVEWDPRKTAANSGSMASTWRTQRRFCMTNRPSQFEKIEEHEERYVTIGMDALGNVLVVVYTWRGERPRLISARKAKPQEREQYGVKP